MKNKDKNLIKKLHNHFDEMEFCVFTDDEYEILFVHHGLACIMIDADFSLSFEVHCDPMTAAIITQEAVYFAAKHDKVVNIFEPYADVMDEEGEIQKTLFGDEAIHYYQTGELPQEEFPEKEEDAPKKVDRILDQIHLKGMKSLSKEQKEFLVNYSKNSKNEDHGKNSKK